MSQNKIVNHLRTIESKPRVLVFHSWIAEYATVRNVTGDRVYFKEPLKHVPIGTYVPSSGWRFLIFNNIALLDMPGEYVCNDLGGGLAQFSYIPLEEQGCNSTDILPVQGPVCDHFFKSQI